MKTTSCVGAGTGIDSFMDGWFEDYGAFDGLTEDEEGVICCNPPVVINNGITITYRSAPTSLPSSAEKIGFSTRNRVNPEDIQSGTNGDDRGIFLAETKPIYNQNTGALVVPPRPYTNQELFAIMAPLFTATTICDNRQNAFRFKDEFQNNTQLGKQFHWLPLSQKIKDHPVMLNYIKRFGVQLSRKLQLTNGVLYSGPRIDMGDDRPKFNKNCSDRPRMY